MRVKRTIQVSQNTYEILNAMKGESTYDNAIREMMISFEILPSKSKEILLLLDSYSKRAVFMTGFLYEKTSDTNVDEISQVEFQQIYSELTYKINNIPEYEHLKHYLDLLSADMMLSSIQNMSIDELNVFFQAGREFDI